MKKLFDNFKLLILESVDLPRSESDQLSLILDEHEVPYDVVTEITKDSLIYNEYTHIIANNVNFPIYEFTQENMIPVMVSNFIFKSVELNKQVQIRPYSPDPKHILKDIHVCIGNLPESDKEAIYGGVRALGGMFSETLNKFVTHLISTDLNEDGCIAVNCIDDCGIKIVLPNWIDDCLKLRKKLDETPYLLSNKINVDDLTKSSNFLDVVDKNSESITAPNGTFLQGKKFYLGSDLELTDRSRDLVSNLITTSGGLIVQDLKKATSYIGKYREGEQYLEASNKLLHVGNLNWIYWMIEHQKWISPFEKLLHYPYVKGGIKEFRDFIIASTNYSGDARFYISRLVEALGATFTSSLKPNNTHLIAAKPTGKKYLGAKQWGSIKIVNHLWLEESYTQWNLQSTDHPRYSHYPRPVNMEDIIGETKLNFDVLKKFYDDGSHNGEISNNFIEDSEGEETTNNSFLKKVKSVTSDKKNLINIEVDSTPLTPKNNNIIEPIDRSTRTPSDENLSKENISYVGFRQSSARKAKDKASAKLHSDMEDLNLFQKQHKSKEIPMLPEEIEAKKRKKLEEEELFNNNKKHSMENTDKEVSNKKTKKTTAAAAKPYQVIAIATGWEIDISKTEMSVLNELGIYFGKEFQKKCNTIISPKFMRTEKFLTGLSYRIENIISPTFLKEVLKCFETSKYQDLPNIKDYSLDVTNSKSVKELTTLTISELLHKSNHRIDSNQRIFQDLNFNISSKIPGGVVVVEKILKAHGANKVNVIKTLKDMKSIKSLIKNVNNDYIFLSNESGMIDKFKSFFSKNDDVNGKIIEWNWVINSIFNMEINNDKNVLFNSSKK